MFFLRPDYEYGKPNEQPEHLDEALCQELRQFLDAIPPAITETSDILPFYQGPHLTLHLMAVTYRVRQLVDGEPSKATTQLFLDAAADTKTWPTRGFLMPHNVDGGGFYEWRGPDHYRYTMGLTR